jgi:heme exporter protein A
LATACEVGIDVAWQAVPRRLPGAIPCAARLCNAGAKPVSRNARDGAAVMELRGIDLGCIRGGRRVFEGVNFSVAAGTPLLLTGANGAGKSSLLRLIAGLIHPDHGTVAIEGGDDELTVGEQTHYLGHLDPLKGALTVMENLAFWVSFLNAEAGPDAWDRAERSLDIVGLGELADVPAGYLSAGQRRRLSLARMVAVPRSLWLLDEPTNALDAASQERLDGLMRGHLGGGGLIVAATHGPLGLPSAQELRLGQLRPGKAP